MAAATDLLAQQAPPAGAHGADLMPYAIAFGLVFVAGFAVVVFVLLSRRREKGAPPDR